MAGKFASCGLKPAGEKNTFFQEVPIRGFDWNTGVPSLKVGSRQFPFEDGAYPLHFQLN